MTKPSRPSRPSRRKRPLLSALLLVLCVAAWLRSYLPEYSTVRTYQGALVLVFYGRDPARYIDPANNPSLDFYGLANAPGRPPPRLDTEQILLSARQWGIGRGFVVTTTKWHKAGFELIATNTKLAWGYFVVAVPFWAICLPLLAATALGLWKWRRQGKWVSGRCCQACGYDLRATPEGNGALLDRCPECGAVPTAREPA
jgi:4-amino-4-deoxy-L-arabinose transferase-like glycosyltransferase